MSSKPSTRASPDQAVLLGQGPYEARGLGTLWLVWSSSGLVRLSLDGVPRSEDQHVATLPIPDTYAQVLDRYFEGEPVDPSELPVDLRGTRFQVRVWEALRRVPRAAVRTYGGIAADVGSPRAARAVGMANASNPVAIVVPCHRVVAQGYRLGGYSGGLDKKRILLELEGARVEGERVLPGQLDLL